VEASERLISADPRQERARYRLDQPAQAYWNPPHVPRNGVPDTRQCSIAA
jgi:hypothetical protein